MTQKNVKEGLRFGDMTEVAMPNNLLLCSYAREDLGSHHLADFKQKLLYSAS
jgi:hypothetical protein